MTAGPPEEVADEAGGQAGFAEQARVGEQAGGADRGVAGSERFLAAFDTLAQAIRRARGTILQAGAMGLTLSQYGLLEPLARRPSARVHELARREARDHGPHGDEGAHALERRGIVERRRASEDRPCRARSR